MSYTENIEAVLWWSPDFFKAIFSGIFWLFKKRIIFKSSESQFLNTENVIQTTPHMEITYIKRPSLLLKFSNYTWKKC